MATLTINKAGSSTSLATSTSALAVDHVPNEKADPNSVDPVAKAYYEDVIKYLTTLDQMVKDNCPDAPMPCRFIWGLPRGIIRLETSDGKYLYDIKDV